MAYTNSTLKGDIADYMHRTDIPMTMITRQAEARINREVRAPETIKSVAVYPNSFGLATDCNEVISLRYPIPGGYKTLIAVGRDVYNDYLYTGGVYPEVYTLQDRLIKVAPEGSQNIEMTLTYYAIPPELTQNNQTFPLMSKNPDLYLYGCLVEAAKWAQNPELIQLYDATYLRIKDSVNAAAADAMHGGVMQIKVA